MSIFRQRNPTELIWQGLPTRLPRKQGSVDVTPESAFSHGAVWAAVRLRADMVSSLPLHCVRSLADGTEVRVPVPAVLTVPGTHGPGQPVRMAEYMYSSQVDLDRFGNTFSHIVGRDALGKPGGLELIAANTVTVRVKNNVIFGYKIGQTTYAPEEIWHERQYTVAGIHVGLSPIAYAAQSLGSYLSAQQFALDWFANGAVPGSILKNTAKTLTPEQSSTTKKRFMNSMQTGEPFVTGMDWDYEMVQVTAAESAFLEAMQFSLVDIGRFFGVPADLLDAEPAKTGTKITYQNITQRNLQFLITHLGPVIKRREAALSDLLSNPRRVKFDTDSLLRMDPAGQQAVTASKIASRTLAPSEARKAENKLPFTEDQLTEFDRLFGPAGGTPTPPVSTEPGAAV